MKNLEFGQELRGFMAKSCDYPEDDLRDGGPGNIPGRLPLQVPGKADIPLRKSLPGNLGSESPFYQWANDLN